MLLLLLLEMPAVAHKIQHDSVMVMTWDDGNEEDEEEDRDMLL